ncbi:MAG TPA: carbohydrate binding family 9 domain-containing protein, partial [Bacteroidales bacterium]|nr:carbohydrate binding family 9 domain-containing protein [Bacteroidales bacterium]HPQ56760.1 carbohydrate binding family 9 domain-containing protein [Bacteroidales bacterium]
MSSCLHIKEVLILCLTAFVLSPLYANDNNPAPDSTQNRIYTTQRIENPPVIDGKLDDACWEAGEWQSNYKQFIPDYNSEPTCKTELKVLYNNKSLFVAIRAYDDMDKITKRLGRRDNYLGDMVGIQLDSYHDRRTAFEFVVTAAGQKMDMWISNDDMDLNWDAVWYVKVAYREDSWTAEFDIPLSQMRYSLKNDQVWG